MRWTMSVDRRRTAHLDQTAQQPERIVLRRKDEQQRAGAAHLHHQRAVRDILAGRAAMQRRRRLAIELRPQRRDERDRQRPRQRRPFGERRRIEAQRRRRRRDRRGGLRRDHPHRRLRRRQCGFEGERRGDRRFIVERRDHRRGGDRSGAEQAHRSKNTVSSAPASRRSSHQSPSPRGCAISVPRRSTGTQASTGSSSLLAAPSK